MKYKIDEVYYWNEDYNPYNHQTYNSFMKILSVRERRIGYQENGLAFTLCSCKQDGTRIGKETCEWTEKELSHLKSNILTIKKWQESEVKRKKQKIKKLKLQIKNM